MYRPPRRHALVCALLVVSLGLGGCLTLSPTVSMDTAGSTVFENATTSEPWASGRVRTSVALTPNATTEGDVSKLTIIAADGSDFDSTTLDSGQTSATVYVPTNEDATLVAVGTVNGTTIEERTITAGGNEVF